MMFYLARNALMVHRHRVMGKKWVCTLWQRWPQWARIARGFGMETYAFDPFSKALIEQDNTHPVDHRGAYETCNNFPCISPRTIKPAIRSMRTSFAIQSTLCCQHARKEEVNEEDFMKMFAKRSDSINRR
jgi:D-3-phosphoglycerate dehydrogenase